MRDRDVRAALRLHLDEVHADDDDTLRIDELALSGRVRIDIAVVNGFLAGFELKSARDNLRRLPVQVDEYSRVLDRATLVVAENHHDRAVAYLPQWWGVTIATESVDGVLLEIDREATCNPGVDPQALVRLLWHAEALAELEARGRADGVRSKPRTHAWQRLADELSVSELGDVVRTRLKARRGWRAGQ